MSIKLQIFVKMSPGNLPEIIPADLWYIALCHLKVNKVKRSIAISGNHLAATGNHMPYGITQCYLPPGSGDFPALLQPKLVLDLATLEGCKAELT